jgi:ABC-2 type transport system permease protein
VSELARDEPDGHVNELAPERPSAELGRALHAEWTKLRTVPGPLLLVLCTVVLTIGVGAAVAVAVSCPSPGCQQDPARLALTGVALGQVPVVALAVLLVGSEYGSGMIVGTLAATRGRGTVLTAKAIVLTLAVTVAGLAASLGSWLTGRILLPASGFTVANGVHLAALTDGPTARAVFGSVAYLVLVGLLSLGLATLVRDSTAALGLMLGILFLFRLLAGLVSDPDWQRHLQQISPMDAGMAIQHTVAVAGEPIGPVAGLGVLAGWAAGGLLLGWLRLTHSDA